MAADSEATPEEALEQLMLDAAAGRQMMAEGNSPQDLVADLAACKSTLQNCQGQTTFLNDRLNATAGGHGLPPCWVTETGAIEYIFAAHLTDAGIVLEDYALPHRTAEQAELPVAGIGFDIPLEAGAFRGAVSSIYGWSVEHECRFYVDLLDETGTGAGAKDLYKRLRRAVEDNFYIRLRG